MFLGSTRDENFTMASTTFFSKVTFHMNKTYKTWGKSLQLPYANEAKFWLNMV